MKHSKKGNLIISSIMVIIILVVFSIITVISFKTWSEIKTDVFDDVTLNESKAVINEVDSRFPSAMDGVFIFLFIGLWMIGIVSVFVSDTHPLLFAIMMVVMVFVVIAGVILGNFYEEFFTDEEMTGLTVNFPMTNWIMTHMLTISIIMFGSFALVYFGRSQI